MRSFSPWVAIVAAGAVQWLVGCSSDDSTTCSDASPGEGSTGEASSGEGAVGDATIQSTAASQDAAADHSPAVDSSIADAGPGNATGADAPGQEAGSSPEAAVATADAAKASEAGPASSDASAASDASDAGPAIVAPTSMLAGIRIANWSPGAPAIDFCIAPHGTTAFQGPILANTAPALVDAGTCPPGPVGLAFTEVSSYSLVQPQQYDVRLVVAGASS
ncbi:MAG: hypothetical protein WBY94_07900, partial [Polyangiaceae bacterium]